MIFNSKINHSDASPFQTSFVILFKFFFAWIPRLFCIENSVALESFWLRNICPDAITLTPWYLIHRHLQAKELVNKTKKSFGPSTTEYTSSTTTGLLVATTTTVTTTATVSWNDRKPYYFVWITITFVSHHVLSSIVSCQVSQKFNTHEIKCSSHPIA